MTTMADYAKYMKQLVLLLKNFEGMFCISNYDTMVTFILGYDRSIIDRDGFSLLEGFQDYVREHVGIDTPMHWSIIVREYMANSDTDAKKMMLQLIDDYFSSNH